MIPTTNLPVGQNIIILYLFIYFTTRTNLAPSPASQATAGLDSARNPPPPPSNGAIAFVC